MGKPKPLPSKAPSAHSPAKAGFAPGAPVCPTPPRRAPAASAAPEGRGQRGCRRGASLARGRCRTRGAGPAAGPRSPGAGGGAAPLRSRGRGWGRAAGRCPVDRRLPSFCVEDAAVLASPWLCGPRLWCGCGVPPLTAVGSSASWPFFSLFLLLFFSCLFQFWLIFYLLCSAILITNLFSKVCCVKWSFSSQYRIKTTSYTDN